jgi:hypothetical protein
MSTTVFMHRFMQPDQLSERVSDSIFTLPRICFLPPGHFLNYLLPLQKCILLVQNLPHKLKRLLQEQETFVVNGPVVLLQVLKILIDLFCEIGKLVIDHDARLELAPESSLVLVFGGLFKRKEKLQVFFVNLALCICVDLDVIAH